MSQKILKSTGNGGSNRHKVKASCRLTHLMSGIVKTAQTRSRENSFRMAQEAMLKELSANNYQAQKATANDSRAKQIGSGMRGNKVRTYREQDNMVTDHRSERKASLKQIEQGRLDLLWNLGV